MNYAVGFLPCTTRRAHDRRRRRRSSWSRAKHAADDRDGHRLESLDRQGPKSGAGLHHGRYGGGADSADRVAQRPRGPIGPALDTASGRQFGAARDARKVLSESAHRQPGPEQTVVRAMPGRSTRSWPATISADRGGPRVTTHRGDPAWRMQYLENEIDVGSGYRSTATSSRRRTRNWRWSAVTPASDPPPQRTAQQCPDRRPRGGQRRRRSSTTASATPTGDRSRRDADAALGQPFRTGEGAAGRRRGQRVHAAGGSAAGRIVGGAGQGGERACGRDGRVGDPTYVGAAGGTGEPESAGTGAGR